MSNVKRYWIKSNGGLLEDETGNLVYFTDYQSLQEENERLRNGIKNFLSGDYMCPRSYRPDQCPHAKYYWEDCTICDETHFNMLLEKVK